MTRRSLGSRIATVAAALCIALAPCPGRGQTPVHPRVLVIVDTSGSMLDHTSDTCSSGGDAALYKDASIGFYLQSYDGLPGPVNPTGCVITCYSTTSYDGFRSRLYNAKQGLGAALAAIPGNIDWGLMRFAGTWATPAANPFHPHVCESNGDCASNLCSAGICQASTDFDCATGEVVRHNQCGTDTNLVNVNSSYEEANCTKRRFVPITYSGTCGTSAAAGSPQCATPQTCLTDSDCNGGTTGSCEAVLWSASKACKSGGAFTCPTNYTATAGRCVYNLGCQASGGLLLNDPSTNTGPVPLAAYVDEAEDYTPNGSGQPTNPELRADGNSPVAGAIRSATTWYSSISASNADAMITCRPYALVLITDGNDSCDASATGGPVAAAHAFVAATVPGAAHVNAIKVIGFAFANPDATLNAIAHAGGTGTASYATGSGDVAAAIESFANSLLPSVSVTGSTTVCTNSTAGTASSTNATAWGFRTVSGGTVTSIPGATSPSYLIRASDFPGGGTYYLVAGNCNFGSVSNEVAVTISALPNATITAPAQVPARTPAAASVPDAGTGATYTWVVTNATFTGQGTSGISFTAPLSGTVVLNVSVQSAVGCTSTATRSVNAVPSFTDDPLVGGTTPIKAIHLFEIRESTNYIRAKAAMAAQNWTDPATSGVAITASQIIEVRDALTPALTILGTTPTYTDPHLTTGDVVKAVHFQEIREYTRQ